MYHWRCIEGPPVLSTPVQKRLVSTQNQRDDFEIGYKIHEPTKIVLMWMPASFVLSALIDVMHRKNVLQTISYQCVQVNVLMCQTDKQNCWLKAIYGKNMGLVDGHLEKREKRKEKKNDCEAVIFCSFRSLARSLHTFNLYVPVLLYPIFIFTHPSQKILFITKSIPVHSAAALEAWWTI